MKNITLLIVVFISSFVSAQTTYDLDWAIGINGEAASLTIETGDTVRWTWTDEMQHDVISLLSSQESFDSGIMTGSGTQFEYTFTEVGINSYQCSVHPGNMFGTITVEPNLSTEDKFIKNLTFYPNPATNKITISSLYKIDTIEIYNAMGSLVLKKQTDNNLIETTVSQLQSGVYLLVVKSNDLKKVFKLIKK